MHNHKNRTTLARVGEVAFIGALAAAIAGLVSPVVGAARLSEAAAVCQDNERRIGSAILRYADDYGGVYPMNRTPQGSWKVACSSYAGIAASLPVGSSGVFRCPTNPAAWSNGGDEDRRWPRSYAYNGALGYGKYVATNGETTTTKTTDFRDPSGFMLVLESRNFQADIGPWMIDGYASPDGSWSNTNVVWQDENRATGRGCFHHHEKRLNVIMLDGRVKAVTLPQTILSPQMWNPWRGPGDYESKLERMLPEYK